MPNPDAACLTCGEIPCECSTPKWPTDLQIPGEALSTREAIRDTLIDCMTSFDIHGDKAAEAADLILSAQSGLFVQVIP